MKSKNELEAVNQKARLESLEKCTYLTTASLGLVTKIIEYRQQPIRAIVKAGNYNERKEQESNIIDVLHAVIDIYTSADFSKHPDKEVLFMFTEMKNFVVEHYSMLSIGELREAFSLASSGKIKADLRAWNGKFTISMLGEVLGAYLKYSNNIIYQYDKNKDLILSREKKEAQKRSKNEQARKEVIQAYTNLKKQYHETSELDESKIYHFWAKILVEGNYMRFTNEEKKAIYKEAQLLVAKDIKNALVSNEQAHKRKELRKLNELIDSKQWNSSEDLNGKVVAKYGKLLVKKSIIRG